MAGAKNSLRHLLSARVDLRILQVFVIFAKLQIPPNSAAVPLPGLPAALRYDSVLAIRRLRTPANCHR